MTKTKSRHGLDMLAEVPDLRKPRGKRPGLFSFRLFVHFRRKIAIRRSLGQGKVLD